MYDIEEIEEINKLLESEGFQEIIIEECEASLYEGEAYEPYEHEA